MGISAPIVSLVVFLAGAGIKYTIIARKILGKRNGGLNTRPLLTIHAIGILISAAYIFAVIFGWLMDIFPDNSQFVLAILGVGILSMVLNVYVYHTDNPSLRIEPLIIPPLVILAHITRSSFSMGDVKSVMSGLCDGVVLGISSCTYIWWKIHYPNT